MHEFIQGPFGAVHFVSAILAMIVGALVLSQPKGTVNHKRLGYIYFSSMLALNLSAIPITNMTGSVGLFHLFVVFSLPVTLAALYFPVFARHNPKWKLRHFEFMFWSYIGLIAAFIAEAIVRFSFLLMTNRATANRELEAVNGFWVAALITLIVFVFAEFLFRRYRRRLFG